MIWEYHTHYPIIIPQNNNFALIINPSADFGCCCTRSPPSLPRNPPVFPYLPPSSAVARFTLISSFFPSVCPQGPIGQMLLLRAGIYSIHWVPQGIRTILSLCPPHTHTSVFLCLICSSALPFAFCFSASFLHNVYTCLPPWLYLDALLCPALPCPACCIC